MLAMPEATRHLKCMLTCTGVLCGICGLGLDAFSVAQAAALVAGQVEPVKVLQLALACNAQSQAHIQCTVTLNRQAQPETTRQA